MNRLAALIYLRDVRDLELAIYLLRREKQKENTRYRKMYQTAAESDPQPSAPAQAKKNRAGFAGWAVLFLLLVLAEAVLFIRDTLRGAPHRFIFGVILLMAGALYWLWDYVSQQQGDYAPVHDIQAVQAQLHTPQQIRQEWDRKMERFDREIRTAGELLDVYYSLNVLPAEYRNIVSAFYIYEYMSLLSQSLEDTLAFTNLDDGIHRLSEKLDGVILDQKEEILRLRKRDVSSLTAVDEDKEMLLRLAATEPYRDMANTYNLTATTHTSVSLFFAKSDLLNGLDG